MKRIKFVDTEIFDHVAKDAIVIEDKDLLLAFFVSETKHNLGEVISELESIQNGEKTFEEIMEDYADWTFWNNEGEFTCDKDTAYFEGIGESKYPSMEIPLKELIEILKEWKTFIGTK